MRSLGRQPSGLLMILIHPFTLRLVCDVLTRIHAIRAKLKDIRDAYWEQIERIIDGSRVNLGAFSKALSKWEDCNRKELLGRWALSFFPVNQS